MQGTALEKVGKQVGKDMAYDQEMHLEQKVSGGAEEKGHKRTLEEKAGLSSGRVRLPS